MPAAPAVMLASRTQDPAAVVIDRLVAAGWWFSPKWDGIRAVVAFDGQDAVRITNRRGADITHRYPDVVAQVREQSWCGLLDGEIIVLKGGVPDFASAHLRDAQSNPRRAAQLSVTLPATFIPFDVLERNGQDVRAQPYVDRQALLQAMHPAATPSDQDGHTMWEFVTGQKMEGLVAKRGDSRYRPGRQASWVKIKSTHRVSVIAGPIIPGRGSRGAVGAITMFLQGEDAGLVPVGQVGSGMTDAQLRELGERISAGTPTVIEVEYLEVAPSGVLRNPVFKAIRTDLDPEDCTVTSLQQAGP